MRSRPLMAVLALGLATTSCSLSSSANVETLASSTVPTAPIESTSTTVPPPGDEVAASPAALVVDVGDGTGSTTTPDQSSTTLTADRSTTSTPATTATTQAQTSSPASPTTTERPTTQAPTTRPLTTATPTTSGGSGTETRPEILRLALPTYGGGTFDPNSVSGKNVILWFWGAH